MKSSTLDIFAVAAMGLFLGACGSAPSSAPSSSVIASSSPEMVSKTKTMAKSEQGSADHSAHRGGQVIVSGKYHLEFVPEKGTNSTHLDLFVLNSDNHSPVDNAQVTAEVQLPDGQQKTMTLQYEASGQHYAAELPGKTLGQYQVKAVAKVGSTLAEGRFSFNR